MNKSVTISLDAMGGDHGPEIVVPAALAMIEKHAHLHLILVGDTEILTGLLSKHGGKEGERLRIQHASEVVEMDDLPSQALRSKKDSSMRVAINLVKQGEAGACVSAGNTGALMAIARFVLKTLPGIDRPAIISAIPAVGGHTLMLDLGANADCTPEQLFQFGVMGSALAAAVYGLESPAVGLLNIGAEEMKGNERVKQAGQLLAEGNLNYIGFVEGNDINCGEVDVVVTDGFVGNVSLKTMEGVARMISTKMRESFSSSLIARIQGLLAMPVLRRIKSQLDPRRYNGASLVGLQRVVIKSHGNVDSVAFANAIGIAMLEVNQQVPERISLLLESQFAGRRTG